MSKLSGEHRKGLFMSNAFLQGYGCKNCVWKNFRQCPHGFTQADESLQSGYCSEMVDFISSLAETEDSISAVKEKFHLYTQEMQALADHAEYSRLASEYDSRKANGAGSKELAELQVGILSYRLWWTKLSENVVKGLSRISDREQKKDVTVHMEHKISLSQIHQLADEAKKQLVSDSEKKYINVKEDDE